MKYRAAFLTLIAVFVITWLRQDWTDSLYDLWIYEMIRTALWWTGPVLASLSLNEWMRA